MEKKLSNRILNALNTEVKNTDIIEILFDKNRSTKEDVLHLTGLRLEDYNKLVKEGADDSRKIIYDSIGEHVLSQHVKREDLTEVQKAVSRLLWKWLNNLSMCYRHLVKVFHGDKDDLGEEEVFQEETYQITDEDFEEVARTVLEYVKEINQTV